MSIGAFCTREVVIAERDLKIVVTRHRYRIFARALLPA
jgi:hypothetical protein